MALQTRRPTGAVPWPLILIEGGEKGGKSFAAALLSASPKVGRTLWLDLNEGAADEYGAIPGARYEVIEHDGSWLSIIGQVADAKAEAQRAADAGERPVVLVIDSGTAEWDLLKDWASLRARGTDTNQKKLQRNPDAEISVSMNFWNDAANRHRKLMTMLMTFPGIVVVTARGKEVAALDEKGSPIAGTKDYRVEGHKNLAFDCSCWVRVYRDKPGIIVGARSVHTGVRPGKDQPKPLPADWTLEWLVFDKLKCDPAKARVRDLRELQPGELTPEQIRDEAFNPSTTVDRIRELYAMIGLLGYEMVILPNLKGTDEPLVAQVKRAGKERGQVAAVPAQAASAGAAEVASPGDGFKLETDDPWLESALGTRTLADVEDIRTDLLQTFEGKPEASPRVKALLAILDSRETSLRVPELAAAS